jgi:1-deoxy-D-xylulose-5-phosphate reductoisomerase
VHTVVNALVGSVGLLPTIDALTAGKKVALANKETLVIGGEIVSTLVHKNKNALIPIDSEHCAIRQCLEGSEIKDVEKLIITASGGPFLNASRKELNHATVAQALKHPNWQMGKKITVDSATLMNKGLEVIEAHFLFGIPYDQIEVVVHPQSTIHSMVQFHDGSILAQLGMPDMKIPIQYALSYPQKWKLNVPRVDFIKNASLSFRKPDTGKFPCLLLAYEAGKIGGTLPVVMNAANEIAVELFLQNKITFNQIPRMIESQMKKHRNIRHPSVEEIVAVDTEIRRQYPKESASRF